MHFHDIALLLASVLSPLITVHHKLISSHVNLLLLLELSRLEHGDDAVVLIDIDNAEPPVVESEGVREPEGLGELVHEVDLQLGVHGGGVPGEERGAC